MRVLFSTGSPEHARHPPRFGDTQINCGPGWADASAADGRVRSVATPVGEYDLAALAATLPPDQQPDLVVCHVGSDGRNWPRSVAGFRCPRVLLVADTHQGASPLLDVISYASVEKFDRIVLLHDRHHAGFFRAAGFNNVFWFPGLTFPHSDAEVHAARREVRAARIAFAGSTGCDHPRGTRLLGALASRGLPLATRVTSAGGALGFYGASLVGFNASLNGDVNRRVFEILAAGAALITDRLAPEAGFERVLTDGVEFASYGDTAELAELCEDYLAHPDDARKRGDAGARWFDAVLAQTPRRTAFRSLAFDGINVSEFEFDARDRLAVFFPGEPERVRQSLLVYEHVQELHRTQETVRVLLDKKTVPEDFREMCTTLPRVQLTHTLAEGDVDLAVFGRDGAARITGERTAALWCCDAAKPHHAELAAHFAPAGFIAGSEELATFVRPPATAAEAAPPVELSAAAEIARARALLAEGNVNSAFAHARAALERDLNSAAARVVLGEIALRRDGGPLAEKLFRRALELHADGAVVEPLLADALRLQRKFLDAGDLLDAALAARPHDLPALLALAQLRVEQQQPAAAEAALREAAQHHPASPVATQALGDFLKRTGRASEALGWHRRALGCAEAIAPIDVATRRARVAFVVQNTAGWSAIESAWRAMRDDLTFEPAIIAAPDLHSPAPAGGTDAICALLEQQGVPFVRWDALPLGPGFADIAFLHNAVDTSRPAPLRAANLLRLVPRLGYIAEDLEIGGGAERIANALNQPLQQLAWLVCARSERERASYGKHCATGHAHVAVTGHPKLDALRDLGAVDVTELKKFAAGRKVIGWNPHYDLRLRPGALHGNGASTFLRWWKFVLAEFARRSDLALVIRPHPRFFSSLEARGIWTPAQTDELLERVAGAKNVLLDCDGSHLPFLAGADALMSDVSSLVLEFAATGKPLLYLHNPHGPQLGDDGGFVGAHCDTAVIEADIADFLDRVAAGRDALAVSRAEALGEYLHRPARGAGVAIKEAVLARLAAEARPAVKPHAVAA